MLVKERDSLSKEEHTAILDYVELRKLGQIGVILCEYGRYYRVGDEVDCWGTKERISVEEFVRLVREKIRKPIGYEENTNVRREAREA